MDLEALLADFTHRDWQTVDDSEPIRLALVGLGWWVREEAMPAIEESDFCTTSVVVSGSAEKATRVANSGEGIIGLTYKDYHDGTAVAEYDAVYICTPNSTHIEYVRTAARHGKHVLCEKPMAATSEGAKRIVEVCADEEVTLMVAYRMQTDPAVRRARDIVGEGIIGEPRQIHGHMSDCVPDLIPNPDQWRLDPELSGGATLIDIGLYPLNTARFLLDRDPIAVYAETDATHEWFDGLDEHVSFQVSFDGCVSAACTVSHNAFNASHFTVVGTEGKLTIEPVFFPWDDRELAVSTGEATADLSFEQRNQMTEEFDYFAHCLITDTDPVPDGRHGLVDIEAVEAMYTAAETGERIELS
mgnify:CR=1 FL=1